MTLPLLLVFQAKFFIFVVLGLKFFKKAEHNLGWVMTALPFVLNSGLLTMYFVRPDLLPAATAAPAYQLVRGVAALLCVAAIALYMFTLGTHRQPLPGWHQANDRPDQLVTWGPYRRIRHPFYTSYLLFFGASLLLAPGWAVLVNTLYACLAITYTAVSEERALASHFGSDYQSYRSRTGRFFPV
jgi:protein-S-isoprenylcysteine O-methyltransferase Ste14